jgi:parallel beta-helix repeat protein
VYNITVSNCINGIYLRSESTNSDIYNNTIRDANQGIYVNTDASDNEFRSNTKINATELGVNINEGDDETKTLVIIMSL